MIQPAVQKTPVAGLITGSHLHSIFVQHIPKFLVLIQESPQDSPPDRLE